MLLVTLQGISQVSDTVNQILQLASCLGLRFMHQQVQFASIFHYAEAKGYYEASWGCPCWTVKQVTMRIRKLAKIDNAILIYRFLKFFPHHALPLHSKKYSDLL